jgi:hypothetical protein
LVVFPLRPVWLLLIAAAFTQCRPEHSTSPAAGVSTPDPLENTPDSLEISSFELERGVDNTLKNWQTFKVGRDIVALPAEWKHQVAEERIHFIPPFPQDAQEGLFLFRYNNDIPSLNYDKVVWQRSTNSFADFTVASCDTLKKVELKRGFFYEQNSTLLKEGISYQGYFFTYVNDSSTYVYTFALTKARLAAYDGNLQQDILHNLQIDKQYIFGNHNPARRVIFLKQAAVQPAQLPN